MENIYIGVDVGGMSIKVGAVNLNGEIILKDSIKTDSKNIDNFLSDLETIVTKIVNEVRYDYSIKGIGFGIPGLVDNKSGSIIKMANIDGEKVNVKEKLKHLNLPIYLSNDANVATLAEQRFGVAKGYSDVILLTLGTGVGGGIIINNKLYEGRDGKGTELGHIMLKMDGELCGCGRKGCLEAYASATALIRITKEHMMNNKSSLMWEYSKNKLDNVNGLTSFECAKKGDLEANKVIDEYISYLGEGMIDYSNIFRPEVFVIGGGISNQGEYLSNKLYKYLKDRNFGYKGAPESKVLIAKLKNDAGIIGAASLFME